MGQVRAVLTMTVPPDKAEKFALEWAGVADWVQDMPGCLRQTLARTGLAEPTTFVITSDWVNGDTYKQFETSQRQDERTAGLRELRTGVRMEVLEIVDHRGEA
jgi:heme-degrading monooxygenase HmoA